MARRTGIDLASYLAQAVDAIRMWEDRWDERPSHPSVQVNQDELSRTFAEYVHRLGGNYPFFHPRYAGQMLKPPHPVAVLGYVAAMLINPNNHALDGGPPTSEMEKEIVGELTKMFGFPAESLGHLTSSGTIANLEALWIARELHPEKRIVYGDQAHYTHGRVGDLLRVHSSVVSSDAWGRMRLDALEDVLRLGDVGTVVVTAGTTGLGAVDSIADIQPLCKRYGVRVHVDAAYGGFFALLANDSSAQLNDNTRRHFGAIADCDSVVVDPHKHGLQPYGCGCVLFRDAQVGRIYQHDSPYTYFTSDALHLGEISFECSRAGAAAGAMWLTMQLLPLRSDVGLGPILGAGLRAARELHTRLHDSESYIPLLAPELDILTYFPSTDHPSAGAIDEASAAVFARAMRDEKDPLFLSVMRVTAQQIAQLHPKIRADSSQTRILRSVLMKPEHEGYVDRIYTLLLEAAD